MLNVISGGAGSLLDPIGLETDGTCSLGMEFDVSVSYIPPFHSQDMSRPKISNSLKHKSYFQVLKTSWSVKSIPILMLRKLFFFSLNEQTRQ